MGRAFSDVVGAIKVLEFNKDEHKAAGERGRKSNIKLTDGTMLVMKEIDLGGGRTMRQIVPRKIGRKATPRTNTQKLLLECKGLRGQAFVDCQAIALGGKTRTVYEGKVAARRVTMPKAEFERRKAEIAKIKKPAKGKKTD